MDLALLLKHLPTAGKVIDAVSEWPDEDWDDFDRRCHRWLGSQVGSAFGARTRSALDQVLARESAERGELEMVRQMKPSYPDAEEARLALEDLRKGMAAVGGGGKMI